MKWFQHESNARNDVKLRMLQKQFGNDGYAVYFKILEIISEFAKENNLDEWGFVDRFHDMQTLSEECNVDADRLKLILEKCNQLELFEKKNHRLYCEKILKRLDNYAQQIRRKAPTSKKLRSDNEETSIRADKKRIDKKRAEQSDPAGSGLLSSKQKAWLKFAPRLLKKFNVNDIDIIAKIQSQYLDKGEHTTQKSVESFINSALKYVNEEPESSKLPTAADLLKKAGYQYHENSKSTT